MEETGGRIERTIVGSRGSGASARRGVRHWLARLNRGVFPWAVTAVLLGLWLMDSLR